MRFSQCKVKGAAIFLCRREIPAEPQMTRFGLVENFDLGPLEVADKDGRQIPVDQIEKIARVMRTEAMP